MYTKSVRRSRYVPYILISCSLFALAAGMLGVSGFQKRSGVAHTPDEVFSASRLGARALPRTMLWAWERPEDFNFIDPRETGVAFLAGTINVSPNLPGNILSNDAPASSRISAFTLIPRRQPLRVPDGTALMAVARIEIRASGVKLQEADAREIAGAIARLAEIQGVRAIQIDFDATVSQRGFYSEILRELRLKIPKEMPISITALASWCLGDAWLDGLPIDEAVPMLFRMGVDDRNIRMKLARGEDFGSPVCRMSEGTSTDEVVSEISGAAMHGRRIYWFHPRSWTAAAFHDAVKGAGQ